MEPVSLDCTLCILNQALQAARIASSDVETHARIVERTMRKSLELGLDADPPLFGTIVHRIVREETGDPDPYYAEKKRFNKLALEMIDLVRSKIAAADDEFEATVRFAIAGNSIDFARGALDEKKIDEAIRAAVYQPTVGSYQALRAAVDAAKTILYITDNAGEIVYDRLLVELLTKKYGKDVTVVVRGKPILNDALLEDAQEVGMTDVAPVVGNGGDGLGVIFEFVSDEFKEKYANADLVICKGLANFETLGVGPREITPKKIAFLFKAKCPFIAKRAGANYGDLVVRVS